MSGLRQPGARMNSYICRSRFEVRIRARAVDPDL